MAKSDLLFAWGTIVVLFAGFLYAGAFVVAEAESWDIGLPLQNLLATAKILIALGAISLLIGLVVGVLRNLLSPTLGEDFPPEERSHSAWRDFLSGPILFAVPLVLRIPLLRAVVTKNVLPVSDERDRLPRRAVLSFGLFSLIIVLILALPLMWAGFASLVGYSTEDPAAWFYLLGGLAIVLLVLGILLPAASGRKRPRAKPATPHKRPDPQARKGNRGDVLDRAPHD